MKIVQSSLLTPHKGGLPTARCDECAADTWHIRAHWENMDDYMCLRCSEKRIGGSIPMHKMETGMRYSVNPRNGFGVLMMHYSADPNKNPDNEVGLEWFNEQRSYFANEPQMWDQLMEIAFHVQSGPRIYPEFDPVRNLRLELEFNPEYPLMAQFDWGIRHAACVFSQWVDGEYRVLLELLGDDCPIESFFTWVNRLLKVSFFEAWGLKDAVATPGRVSSLQREGKLYAYGDPAGNNRNTHNMSDIRFVEAFGWHVRFKYGAKPERKITKVRALIRTLEDGSNRFKMRNEAYMARGTRAPEKMHYMAAGSLLSGFMGGYQWDCDARGLLKLPVRAVKDLHSHLMDCVAEGVENTYEFKRVATLEPPDAFANRPDYCDTGALSARLEDPSLMAALYYYDPTNETLEHANG